MKGVGYCIQGLAFPLADVHCWGGKGHLHTWLKTVHLFRLVTMRRYFSALLRVISSSASDIMATSHWTSATCLSIVLAEKDFSWPGGLTLTNAKQRSRLIVDVVNS